MAKVGKKFQEEVENKSVGDAETVSDTKNEITKVTFKIRNSNTKTHTTDIKGKYISNGVTQTGYVERVFTEAEHGANFLELADEFEKSNTFIRPANMNDTKEVEECKAFNANIKHPVLSRENE